MEIVFILTTVICAIKWLQYRIATLATVYYIEKNGYKQPNEKDMKECTMWVAKQMFKIK